MGFYHISNYQPINLDTGVIDLMGIIQGLLFLAPHQWLAATSMSGDPASKGPGGHNLESSRCNKAR